MVGERKVSKHKYLIAAAIALLIFSLGIMLGMVIDNERFRWVTQKSEEQDISYQSLQFQYLYLNTVLGSENVSCSVLHTALEDAISELGSSLDKVLQFQKDTNLNKGDYELLSRKYTIDNFKYWLLAKKTKELCKNDVVIILYFFSEKNCPICPDQGILLTYYKKIFGDRLLVFPINIDLEDKEQTIRMLRGAYDINYYPTIIIEDQKFEGVVDKDMLGNLICKSFIGKQSECEGIMSTK